MGIEDLSIRYERRYRPIEPELALADDLEKIYQSVMHAFADRPGSPPPEDRKGVDEELIDAFGEYSPFRLSVTVGNLKLPPVIRVFREAYGPSLVTYAFNGEDISIADTVLDDACFQLEALLASYSGF